MAAKLLLIDGHAAVYRAYYAITKLTTLDGIPTNAVYGFVRMFKQLLETLHVSHCAVLFDGGLPKERIELLPEYKAQRAPMPTDLRPQFSLVEDYLDAAKIVHIKIDGEEADDLIASLAVKMRDEFDEIYIASADKDLYQIVCEKIKMVAISGDMKIMGPDEIREKISVNPAQVVDWLALVGDSADNIHGVPGVGKKTAADLLRQFNSMGGIFANIDNLKSERIRDSLKNSSEIIRRNIKIIELRRDIDCHVQGGDLITKPADIAKLLDFFEKVGFTSMAQNLREPELF